MQKLDKVEQAVFDAFSQIQVDTEKLKRSVLMNQPRIIKKRFNFSVLLVAALVFAALTATVYAATGGLEAFLSRFNPNFGEFAIAPLEPAYAEVHGIRIEAVGAQQIGHVVLVYMTMQDISGDNRLTRYMHPDLEIRVNGQVMNGPSSGNTLRFEKSTNTKYFEMIIVGEVDMPQADNIEVFASRIQDYEHSGNAPTVFQGDWSMVVNTSDLGIQPIIWTDIPTDNFHFEYLSLSPFGLQMVGSHSYDTSDLGSFPVFEAEVEFENRKRNTKFSGGGGGFGANDFSNFQFANAPIDLETVTAVIINGERIPIPTE